MKKYIILVLGIFLMTPSIYSQTTVRKWTENFDGNVNFKADPVGSWLPNSIYYLPGSLGANPKSYWGIVPKYVGDTVTLETDIYDCTNLTNVIMRFSHICKVSPKDIVRLEYRRDMGAAMSVWDSIPIDTYMGSANNFPRGFNAASYSEWKANDSTVLPSQSWWKEEIFDLSYYVQSAKVQFRFVIIHGQQPGTQASYGWLIDNFELVAATYELYPPIVAFVSPFVKDAVHNTGPWEINAKVKTQTDTGIVRPSLIYTAKQNGVPFKEDTILMDNVKGDSLWKASIPQFVAGTEIIYSITGEDSSGNYATAISGYVIHTGCEDEIMGNGIDYILQDGSTTTGYHPFIHNYGYSQSMSLYPASMIPADATGTIQSIALRVSTAGSGAFPMRIWLKTVPISKTEWDAGTDNLDWSILTQDATLVYDDLFHFSSTGWFDIPLMDNTFLYDGTENLVVMFEQNCGGTSCSASGHMPGTGYSYFYRSSTATNTIWYKNTDNNPPIATSTLYINTYRPDLRINTIPLCADSNSATIHSIDINDTISIFSGNSIPIVVTIKNKGIENLTSATIYYSVNGNTPQSYPLTGVNLPWDFNTQVTIDNYTPKLNGYDTITVWVKMPNGIVDNTDRDDTLTKMVYGSSDIVMVFVDAPADTVYNTGPFEIKARIYTLSGDPLPTISLDVTTTFNGTTTPVSLPMVFDANDNLWKVSIPQKQFGSDVKYSLSLTDKLGNALTQKGSYYIKRMSGGINPGYVTIGTGSVTNYYTPMSLWHRYSFSRQLYYGTELNSSGTGFFITKLAWSYATTGTWNYSNQTCYFRAVDDASITSSAYEDPVAANATQVWSGSIGASAPGWVEITLDQPFLLPPGKNLLVYWNHEHGAYASSTYTWNHTNTTANTMAYGYLDGSFVGACTSNLANNNIRPNARFYITGSEDLDNSVALVSIDSPNNNSTVVGNTPVRVSIRNRGKENLDFCNIEWTLNGQPQPPVTYNGPLPEDFLDTITLGSYFPVIGKRDTITVWVSLPNGERDSITSDDTLRIMPMGCPGIVSGINNIPDDFTSINVAITSILNCGITGKAILEIDPGTYTGTLDLSPLKEILTERDTLVIRPTTGKTGNVVFTAASATPAMRINGIRNLYVERLTLNATAGTHGVEIIGQCDNVEINSCIINLNTTATSAANGCGVYYNGSSSGPSMGNIRLLNNTITNGYSGIYLYYLHPSAATQVASTSWVRITGNTIENSYNSGIYSYYYSRYDSIAYNTINTRAVSVAQYGMYLNYYNRVNDGIIGNKINIRGTSTSYGIYSYNYLNSSTTGAGGVKALIANNEIRKLSGGGTFYGLIQYYNVASYINNSVYAEGTSTNYGMYISYSSTTYPCTIMNNLFISAGTNTANQALYCPTATYATPGAGTIMDYNDYYSTGTSLSNLGATLPLLQTATQQDANSVNILPAFLNTANSLEVISNTGLTVSRFASVNQDINRQSRLSPTMMGAYEVFPTKHDIMLLQFASWNNDVVKGQTVQINIDAINLGVPITGATFGWSLNGQTQSTSVTWTATTVLGSFEQQTIPVLSFVATGADTFDIVVWIETINGQQDETNWNDTVSATAFIAPLAEFVAPFISDTIGSLSFDVNIKIRGASGAPVNAPEMHIYVEACNSTISDTLTVPLVQEGDKWVARVPKQYYSSTVIYETYISDGVYNITLRDTTYIMFGEAGGEISSDYPYTGSVQTVRLPAGTYELECWGANGGYASSNTNTTTGSNGGYSKGTLSLSSTTTIFVYAGGAGDVFTAANAIRPGGWNGGGTGYSGTTAGAGGGASDIRVLADDLYNRIIVAGGGGGYQNDANGSTGGHGGGLNGINSSVAGVTGGSQTTPGSSTAATISAGFGIGASKATSYGCGGGGGWYGGGATSSQNYAGGGGSGYILTSNSHKPSGYFPQNASYYLANAYTTSINEEGGTYIPNPSGRDGHVRITLISGGDGDVYAGADLAIFNLLSPKNIDGEMCMNVSSPAEIELVNLGETDYDFTNDNITISYEIINPRRIIYSGNISIDTGELLSGKAMTIELVSTMPIVAGNYEIKAWVTSAIDNFSCDDTLNTVYTPNLIALPVDEDFSSNILSSDFIAIPVIGEDAWSLYTDPTSQIAPPSGNGMMQYIGSYGSMSVLTTRQLDLSGVVDPEMKFWYYHDATASDLDRSYTDVNVIVDGVLFTAMTLDRKGATTGWEQYTIDLKPYTHGQCVLIQFESMNIFDANSAQYLGHITITSSPDLAVSSIVILPEISICELDNKDLSVVITTMANQAIDFSLNPTDLAVEVPGYPNPFTVRLEGVIPGSTSYTIPIMQNITIPKGKSIFRAYLTSPVDNNALNDRDSLVLDIQPDLSVKLKPVTTGNSRINMGTKVWQEVIVENTGNVELSEIGFVLRITGTNQDIVRDTLRVNLAAKETRTYQFVNPYIVPEDASYQVSLIAYLLCDSANVNTGDATDEYVDMHNLSVISIDNPPMGQLDTVGATVYITVSITNIDDANSFEHVSIYAVIENEAGQSQINRLGSIDEVLPLETKQFTFGEPYTVPADSVYRIRVYLGNGDSYPEDDTTEMVRRTVRGNVSVKGIDKANVFTLSQNIPNPANNRTRIDYSIPEAGKVIFHVHSVSGQLLYSRTIEAAHGKQNIELNTSSFAAGIYFYSIEYKGQRLVKRMMISD